MQFRLVVGVALLLTVAVTAAVAQPVEPYRDPPFADECTFRHFGEGEAPDLADLPDDDPLCVEYEKQDITVANGGAVGFLLAEPARFAAALPACRYWQVDHWSIQLAPDTIALVAWDGSYWFDKGVGEGAVRMRNFSIAGQPASPDAVADLVEPLSADLAEGIRTYGDPSGGGGMTFVLGAGDPSCVTQTPPDQDPEPTHGDPPPQQEPDVPLPTTGGGSVALALLLGATAVYSRRR